MHDVWQEGLAGWDYLGRVGPDWRNEGAAVNDHEDAHYH